MVENHTLFVVSALFIPDRHFITSDAHRNAFGKHIRRDWSEAVYCWTNELIVTGEYCSRLEEQTPCSD